jgi:ubiquinone/menaquinone biosynthesis C-methylase UbiE
VRGSAQALPFGDRGFGAVTCWNAPQVLPEPRKVIGEVGRCLKPGGTFTVLTFRKTDDPIHRYFQRRHGAAFLGAAFSEQEIRMWLEEAGMEILDLAGPESFLLFNARNLASDR